MLAEGLAAAIPDANRTVPPGTATLPGHLHLCFPGVEREELLVMLGEQGICASGGSSCASGALEASHVLSAMGIPGSLARGAIRFTLGPGTTRADVERAVAVVPALVESVRHDGAGHDGAGHDGAGHDGAGHSSRPSSRPHSRP